MVYEWLHKATDARYKDKEIYKKCVCLPINFYPLVSLRDLSDNEYREAPVAAALPGIISLVFLLFFNVDNAKDKWTFRCKLRVLLAFSSDTKIFKLFAFL